MRTAPHFLPTSWTIHGASTRELVATSQSLLPPPQLWHLCLLVRVLREGETGSSGCCGAGDCQRDVAEGEQWAGSAEAGALGQDA